MLTDKEKEEIEAAWELFRETYMKYNLHCICSSLYKGKDNKNEVTFYDDMKANWENNGRF